MVNKRNLAFNRFRFESWLLSSLASPHTNYFISTSLCVLICGMGVAEGLGRHVCVVMHTDVKSHCRYLQLDGHWAYVCMLEGRLASRTPGIDPS